MSCLAPRAAVCPACGCALVWRGAEASCSACGSGYASEYGIPILVAGDSEHISGQALWFDNGVDSAFEIERPQGLPSLYGWLLRKKFTRSVEGLALRGTTALVVCGGSGMDAEFLAREGAAVVTSDISLERDGALLHQYVRLLNDGASTRGAGVSNGAG